MLIVYYFPCFMSCGSAYGVGIFSSLGVREQAVKDRDFQNLGYKVLTKIT